MNKYTLAETISKKWAIEKTRENLKKELLNLLILLPDNDLKDIYNNLK
jgi:hypothetical protein